jgi:hypothetical protein
MQFDVDRADKELRVKTLTSIQLETAATWGARAAVAYRFYAGTRDVSWLLDAEEYYHEAVEHAALAGVFDEVHAFLEPLRQQSRM